MIADASRRIARAPLCNELSCPQQLSVSRDELEEKSHVSPSVLFIVARTLGEKLT